MIGSMELAVRQQLFIENIDAELKRIGSSRAELGRRMDVSQQVIAPYLSGKRCSGLNMVEKFATALGTHPSKLLTGELFEEQTED
jgi:transcriptional regulator with XRE-family HTH domain